MTGGRKGKPKPRTLEDAFAGDERIVDPSTNRRQPRNPPRGQAQNQGSGRSSQGGGRHLDRAGGPRGQQSRSVSTRHGNPVASNQRSRSPRNRVNRPNLPSGNNTLTVPSKGDGQQSASGSTPSIVVESSSSASSYASVAKKMVIPRGICQVRIAIQDKDGKMIPIKADQWPATITDFSVYLEKELDWAKVGSGEIIVPTWQAEGHNGQHAYICPTDDKSCQALIDSWGRFKPKVGNTTINFVASIVAKEEWICQLRIATWTIPSDPKQAVARAENDVRALILQNNIPGKWTNAKLKPSAQGSGTILSWEPDQVMIDYLKSKWAAPNKPDIMNIKWKFDGRPHYIHMHDLVSMRQKRTGGARRLSTTSTSSNEQLKENDPLTKAKSTSEVTNPEHSLSVDERIVLIKQREALNANDKQGKLIQLNERMQLKPSLYAGIGFFYNKFSLNLTPVNLQEIKSIMQKKRFLHDGVIYYFDPIIGKLNIYSAVADDKMETEETNPQLDPKATCPPRLGSPTKGTLVWQWEGDMSQVNANISALIEVLKKGGFIHLSLARWLDQWVFSNKLLMSSMLPEARELLQGAVKKAYSGQK